MRPDDPRHGTRAGYYAHRSDAEEPCEACLHGQYLARKRDKVAALEGAQLWAPLGDVRSVLQPWLDQGFSPSAIAVAAGMGDQRGSHITRVLSGRQPVVRATTFARFAAIGEDDFADGALVDAALTVRRIQSLMAAGHPLLAMPVNPRGTWRTRPRVSAALARAIRAHFQAREMEPGTSAHTRSRALAAGYRPPLAWDDPGTLGAIHLPPWVSGVADPKPRRHTWDTPDHRACPRCGVVREARAGSLCIDCRDATNTTTATTEGTTA